MAGWGSLVPQKQDLLQITPSPEGVDPSWASFAAEDPELAQLLKTKSLDEIGIPAEMRGPPADQQHVTIAPKGGVPFSMAPAPQTSFQDKVHDAFWKAADTSPLDVAKSAYGMAKSGVTLFGDVLSGKTPVNVPDWTGKMQPNPEVIDRSMDVAMSAPVLSAVAETGLRAAGKSAGMQSDRALAHANPEEAAPLGLAAGVAKAAPKLTVAMRMPDGTVKYGEPGQVHGDLYNKYNYTPGKDDQGFAVQGGPLMSRDTALGWLNANEPSTAAKLQKAGPAQPWGKLEANDMNVASGDYVNAPPLVGMPSTANIPGVGEMPFGPTPAIRQAALDYMKNQGMKYMPPRKYVPVDPERAALVAQEFEKMPHDPTNPDVASAYGALIDQTKKQYDAINKTGLKVEPIPSGMQDPYAASPRLAQKDVVDNNHLWFYPTEGGFGPAGAKYEANHPMLQDSGVQLGGVPLKNNDLFRIVHDVFGHIKEGVGFRATGEDNAFRQHRAMFTPEAQRALATETRGQNSWLNYGPHGDTNRTASTNDTTFADQKVGLMPNWATLYSNNEKAAPLSLAAGVAGDATQPMRMYHGTTKDFEKFDPNRGEFGPHLGTADQANGIVSRMVSGNKSGTEVRKYNDAGRVMPLNVDAKNSLLMKDQGLWDPLQDHFIKDLTDKANLTPQEVAPLEQMQQRLYESQKDGEANDPQGVRDHANDYVRQLLQSKGYDSIKYLNKHEGTKPALSYIPLKQGTVKNAISGSTMYSNPEETAPLSLAAGVAQHDGPIKLAGGKVTGDVTASPEGTSIFGWSSHAPGSGNTVTALKELKTKFGGDIAVHDIGAEGTPSNSYWRGMKQRGLVDSLHDENGTTINSNPEEAAPLSLAAGVAKGDVPAAPQSLKAKGRKAAITANPLRNLPFDEAARIASTEQHVIPKIAGVGHNGGPAMEDGYVGAPSWVRNRDDLQKMRDHFDGEVKAGLVGGDWYPRAQGGIREMAGPDPARQHLSAQELALTSAQANPDTNLGFALGGHNAFEAGVPVTKNQIRTGQQARTYEAGRASGEVSLGRKTGVYAGHLDPTMENPVTGTNDIWHARSFGYTNPKTGKPFDRALSQQQHAFMDAETILAVQRANAQKLGGRSDWSAGEIQAAPWVAGKGRDLHNKFPKRFPTLADGVAEASKTYPDFFNKYTANAPYEMTPGRMTGHHPGLVDAPLSEREAFTNDPRARWTDEHGRDIIYGALGMHQRPTVEATGMYRPPAGGPLEQNPSFVARPMVGMTGKSGAREVDPASRAMLNIAEGSRAYFSGQGAGAWSKMIHGNQMGKTNALSLTAEGKLTPEQLTQLSDVGGRYGMPEAYDTGRGAIVTGQNIDKKNLAHEMKYDQYGTSGIGPDSIANTRFDQVIPGTEMKRAQMDSGYLGYEDAWSKGVGSGEATRQLQGFMSNPNAPSAISKLDASPELRKKTLDLFDQSNERAALGWDAARPDLQNARRIFSESGFTGLFEALKKGVVALPVAALVLGPLLQQQGRGE